MQLAVTKVGKQAKVDDEAARQAADLSPTRPSSGDVTGPDADENALDGETATKRKRRAIACGYFTTINGQYVRGPIEPSTYSAIAGRVRSALAACGYRDKAPTADEPKSFCKLSLAKDRCSYDLFTTADFSPLSVTERPRSWVHATLINNAPAANFATTPAGSLLKEHDLRFLLTTERPATDELDKARVKTALFQQRGSVKLLDDGRKVAFGDGVPIAERACCTHLRFARDRLLFGAHCR